MRKYVMFFLLLLIVSNMLIIIVSASENSLYYLNDNCNSITILIDSINDTIKTTMNNTSIEILHKIENLLKELDCNITKKIIEQIILRTRDYTASKEKHSTASYKEYYSRLKDYPNTSDKASFIYGKDRGSYETVSQSINCIAKNKNSIDPLLIIINIVSIASFILGIYILRIIKKRTDYI